MAKKVRYNGGNESYYACSNSKNLILGKIYEVILERDYGFQTNYELKGVTGEYNSVWFDEVQNNVYIATAYNYPVVGERYHLYKMEFSSDDSVKLISMITSKVVTANELGNNIFRVVTQNSTYYVGVSK